MGDNIKMDLPRRGMGGMDSIGQGSREYFNEHLGFIKWGEFVASEGGLCFLE